MTRFIFFFCVTWCIDGCTSMPAKSNIPDSSNGRYFDKTLPRLESGIYLIDNLPGRQSTTRQLYYYFDTALNTLNDQSYHINTQYLVAFTNLDSVYIQQSASEYKGFFDVVLKFNSAGSKQFLELTRKTIALSGAEKETGLLIGFVLKNTLVQVSHVFEPMDTNIVLLQGGNLNRETANDIKYIILKER